MLTLFCLFVGWLLCAGLISALAAHLLTLSFFADDVAPTLVTAALAHGQAGVTHLTPVVANFTFAEPVFGVTRALFAIGGSCGFNQVVVTFTGFTSYSLAINCTMSGMVTAALNNSAVAAVTDAAGNPLASSALQVTAIFDVTRAHVWLAPSLGQVTPLTRVSPVRFNATYSELVTGVSASAFVVSGTATTGTVTVTPLSAYSFEVAVQATGYGSVVLTAQAGSVFDAAGNSPAGPFPTASVNFGEQRVLVCSLCFVCLLVGCFVLG